MAGPIKRLNYFDHQFLRAQDFSDEQTYHLEMRRLHNSLFHSWGIATGMAVSYTPGTSVASVDAGKALDADGNEIVLAAATPTQDVSAMKSQTVFVTIAYSEMPTDPSTDAGASGNTRITETGAISVAPALPSDPSRSLLLASLVTDANGKITSVDPTIRRIAGASGADVQVHSLTLTDANNPVTTWPKLSVSAQASSNLTGNLAVAGNLTAGGAITATGALTSGAITCPGLTVTGSATAVFNQAVEVHGALQADSSAAVTGNLTVGGAIKATGALASGAITCPGITVNGPSTLTGPVTLSGNITSTGALSSGAITCPGINVTGSSTLTGAVTTGPVSCGSNLVVSGAATVNGNLQVNSNVGVTAGRLSLSGGNGPAGLTTFSSLSYNARHNAANSGFDFLDATRTAVSVQIDDNSGYPRFEITTTTNENKTGWQSRFAINGESGDTHLCEVAGSVFFHGAAVNLSDERLKDSILAIEDPLAKVSAIRGVSYNLTARPERGREIGVIAQEVEKVLPELVVTCPNNGMKAVDYGKLTAVLLEAIKQLKQEVEELRGAMPRPLAQT